MYFELKENKPHGTKDDPFSTYHIKNEGRSLQIPAHWHDELEIIYVKSGFLTVSISGENYIGTPGDAFVVSPGNLHFMGSQTGTVDYFTFLFPLKYISFCINDMLDDELKTAVQNEFPANIQLHFFSAITQEAVSGLKDKLWNMLIEKAIICLRYFDKREPFMENKKFFKLVFIIAASSLGVTGLLVFLLYWFVGR